MSNTAGACKHTAVGMDQINHSKSTDRKPPVLRKRANTKLNLLKSTFSKKQVLDGDLVNSSKSAATKPPLLDLSTRSNPTGTKSPLLRKRANTKLNLLKSTFSKKQLLDGTNNVDVSIRDISMLGTSVLEEEETPRRGSGVGREEASTKRRPRRLRLKSIKSLFGGMSMKKRPNASSESKTVEKERSDKIAQAVSGTTRDDATSGKTKANTDEEDGVDGEEMIKLKNNVDDHYVKVDDRERIQNFSHLHW